MRRAILRAVHIALEPFGAQAEATELVEQVDMSSSLLTSPAYTILGQPAPNGYKGIVIQNGKKIILLYRAF